MLIDWFTVGAQTLNFLILVWLLKRFLYKPILDAIDGREKIISKKLSDADQKNSEALKEREEFQKKNSVFDQQRAALLSQATTEVQAERQRLLDVARLAADTLRSKQQAALQSEEQHMHEAITRRTHEEVFALTRKMLADLAGATLEERMTEVFVKCLQALDGDAKESLIQAWKTAAIKTSPEPMRVRSAFVLPPAQQGALQQALRDLLSAEIEIEYETAPDLLSGIELNLNGQKLAWNMHDYLEQLEKSITTNETKPVGPDNAENPLSATNETPP